MSVISINDLANAKTVNAEWKGLYRVGGVAALIIILFIPIQVGVFILWPPPGSVIGWFNLFHENKFLGLLDMDLLLIVDEVLFVFILLALWAALRRTSPSGMAIALLLGMVGVVAYLASATAFEMLSLSNQYITSYNDIDRTSVLAAGKVMMATWQGTAFDVGYILGAVSGIIIAFMMLKSGIFSKFTAWMGLITNLMMLIPPTAGTVGLTLSLLSLIPLEIWLIMVAKRLLQLSEGI